MQAQLTSTPDGLHACAVVVQDKFLEMWSKGFPLTVDPKPKWFLRTRGTDAWPLVSCRETA